MASFKGVSEKFRLTMVDSDGQTEPVTVQIGMDGLKVMSPDATRTKRSYDLNHISRWQSSGVNLILYTKTPVDVEERQLTFTGDSHTLRSALDTLTCSCMQLVEILQSGQSPDLKAANDLHALVVGGGKKKSTTQLPTADSVEYWHQPEKEGWLQSQGDHTRLWRRRWFVLKQGFLFRFLNSSVSESTKPRGVVDLSTIQDVQDGRGVTGKVNSIQLKTSTGGSVCYLCDGETELVEWMSALESSVQKIVRHLAGIEDEPPAPKTVNKPSNDWVRQVEKQQGSGSSQRGKGQGISGYVDIVGYESGNGTNNGSLYGSVSRRMSEPRSQGSGRAGGGTGITDDTLLNYGGAYPQTTATSTSSSYSAPSSYPRYPSASGPSPVTTSYTSQYYPQAPAPEQVPAINVSLIDQVPSQQPSYPYFQPATGTQQDVITTAPLAPPPAAPVQSNTWQMHYSPEGIPYYYNTATGHTQWEAPQ